MTEQKIKREEEKLTELIEQAIKNFSKETDKIVDRVNISPIYKAGTREIISYNIRPIIRGEK